MDIGKKIYELRKSENLSQEQLAEKEGLNVTRQTISNWELGQTVPDINQVTALAKIFKISLDELVDNDIQNVIVQKIAKTEKITSTTNILLKFLLFTIICFIILIAIAISMYIINSTKLNNKIKLEKQMLYECQIQNRSKKIYCTIDNREYGYEFFYNADYTFKHYNVWFINQNVNGSNFEVINFKNYTDVRILLQNLKQFCENNGGTYKEFD